MSASKSAASESPATATRKWPVWLRYADNAFFFALFLFALARSKGGWRLAGVLLGLPSFVLWIIAKLQLGGSFTVTAQARRLVTRGLYSRFRHPIYYFSTLFLLATALCLRNIYFYVYLLLMVAGQLWRIRSEERALLNKFGEDYREYRQRTWF